MLKGKILFRRFYPTKEIASAYDIPYEEYYKGGKRGVIYDIDNTLVMHGAPADERSIELFERLRALGYDTVLLSNNKDARVRPFAEAVGSKYICKAAKPAKKGYEEAMRLMGTDPSGTLFVGDQLFTDIWGANRTGIETVLTTPIDPREEIQIVLKRRLEKIVLRAYHKNS